MGDVLKDLKSRKPVIGATGYWLDTETMEAVIEEIEGYRGKNVGGNVGHNTICRHCRGRGWISTGIFGCDPCDDCGEDEQEVKADEPEDEQDG